MAAIDVDTLTALLDEDFGPWAADLTPLQRTALSDYQEGWGSRVNEYLRDEVEPSFIPWEDAQHIAEILDELETAVIAGRLLRDLVAFRGISDVSRVFDDVNPADLIGEDWVDNGFMSTTIDRDLAVEAFAVEPEPGLFELDLRVGQPAAWLPLGGGALYYEERELLLPCGSTVMIREVVEDDTGLLVIRAEVES